MSLLSSPQSGHAYLERPTNAARIPLQPRQVENSGLGFSNILRTLLRNKWLVIASALVLALLTLGVTSLMTRRYQSTASVQVLNQSGDLSGSRLSGVADQTSDPLDFNMSLQTQVNVLNSETLALQVIKELGLRGTRDYRFKHALDLNHRNEQAADGGLSPAERVWLVEQFRKHLSVTSIPGTRVIQVDFLNPDPQVAAAVPNQLLQDFQAYNYKAHYEAALGPSGTLSQELERLRQSITKEDAAAAGMQQKAGSYGADNYSVVVTRLQAVNRMYLDAESNVVLKKAVYDATRSGDPELISALVGPGGSTPLSNGGLALIENLREQEAQANAEYAQLKSRYGENYPKLTQMKDRVDSLSQSIKNEVRKLQNRAYSDYSIAKTQEADSKQELQKQTDLANKASDTTTNYAMMKDEADADRKLYLNLSEKLAQAKLVAGLQSSNFSIIDPARVPSVPASPKRLLLTAAAFAVGLVLGAILSLLRDGSDKRLRTVEEAQDLSGMPVLGPIPRFSEAPQSSANSLVFSGPMEDAVGSISAAEAYRSVRTALLLSRPDSTDAMVCLVTSAADGEGKTTTAVNVAAAFAKLAGRTLLIDADLRRGTIGSRLQLRNQEGLTEALRFGFKPSMIQAGKDAGSMDVLGTGALPSDPSELLTSEAFKALLTQLRQQYRFIFIDTPPTALFTDAVVLASHVDYYLFVVRPGLTNVTALSQSLMRIGQTQARCLGLLVNGTEPNASGYANYNGRQLHPASAA